MVNPHKPDKPSQSDVLARLDATARLLADPTDIDPTTRKALAELVEEMRSALQSGKVSAEAVAPLAANTARLAESLHQSEDASVLEQIQASFREAILNAEAHHPVAAGMARGVLDTLTGFGL